MTSKLQLNSFQLKTFALLIMTIDHLAFYQTFTNNTDINSILRIIGRIAAPLFLFLLAEGLHHTKSKTKYILRLYIASTLTEILNTLFLRTLTIGYNSSVLGNIFTTFFYVAFYVYFIERLLEQHKNKKISISTIIILLLPFLSPILNIMLCQTPVGTTSCEIIRIFFPSPLTINYSILFVIIGVLWYFINNKYINSGILAALSLLSLIIPETAISQFTANLFNFNANTLFINPQWCMFLAIPFMLLYNGKKGPSTKYFFYFYYPLHQYFLFLLYLLIRT